jgi:hypothetical protein
VSVRLRLTAFAAALAVVFAVTFTAGAALAPDDDERPPPTTTHGAEHQPTDPSPPGDDEPADHEGSTGHDTVDADDGQEGGR